MTAISRRTFASLAGLGAASLALGALGVPTALAEDKVDDVSGFPIVEFGSYPQDGDTPTPIEWLVLEKSVVDRSAILLSRKCLTARPFHGKLESVDWGKSDLRSWLNWEFFEEAFSDEERELVVPQHLENEGGRETDDVVFCLSVQEVSDYFTLKEAILYGNESNRLVAYPTEQALKEGAETNDKGACHWYLRTMGIDPKHVAHVEAGGYVSEVGWDVNYKSRVCVRPAIVVKAAAIS